MSTATTTTSSLSDSLQTIIASARVTRVFDGKMVQFCDKVTLGEGTGLSWHEISLAHLTAQTVTENTELDNPQEVTDTKFTITPTVIGVHTILTDRVRARIARIVYSQIGGLGQAAIEKKRDTDGIAQMDSFTTSLCGAGSTLTSGHITAATSRIAGNSTEPWDGPVVAILHPYGVKDLKDEIIAGVGTYPVPEGVTARVFQDGSIVGKLGGAFIVEDGNISVDSADDAKGGLFASGAGGCLVHVQGRSPWVKEVRNEKYGGGATEYLHYDEYAYGERSSGNWGFEIYHDAAAASS